MSKSGDWYKAHPNYKREWYAGNLEKNREYAREYARKWRAANPEKSRESARIYRIANKDRRRDYNRSRLLPKPTRPEPLHCECCGRPPGKRALNLDHCHSTNIFRGWICSNCNRAIGLLGDGAEGVQMALDYLSRWRS